MEYTLYRINDLQSNEHLRRRLAKSNGAYGSLVRIYDENMKFWLKPDGKEHTKIEDEAGIFAFETAWDQHKDTIAWSSLCFETLNDPIHPGVYIDKVLLPVANISRHVLAKQTGMPCSLVHRILAGNGGITARNASILGNFLGTSPNALLSQQNYYDLWKYGHRPDKFGRGLQEHASEKSPGTDKIIADESDGHDKTVVQTPVKASAPAPAEKDHSIIAKVLADIAAGSLRFALFGTSDGGVEIWRAPAPTPLPTPAVQEIEAPACNATTACKLLGAISLSSLWKLENRGIVTRLQKSHYSIEHLKKVAAANASIKMITKWKRVQLPPDQSEPKAPHRLGAEIHNQSRNPGPPNHAFPNQSPATNPPEHS